VTLREELRRAEVENYIGDTPMKHGQESVCASARDASAPESMSTVEPLTQEPDASIDVPSLELLAETSAILMNFFDCKVPRTRGHNGLETLYWGAPAATY
jgi:hypothetical protein